MVRLFHFVISSTIIWCSLPSTLGQDRNSCSSRYHVDYVILALQWVPSIFTIDKSWSTITRPREDFFSIHGLWPQSDSGTGPRQCCHREKFNTDQVPNLVDMNRNWKSYRPNGSSSFWRHEWNSHGTCGANIPAINTVRKYFSFTLAQFDQLDLMSALSNRSILPSNTGRHSGRKIANAIENHIGSRVFITCKPKYDDYSVAVLQEVRICFDRELRTLIDCPRKTASHCMDQILLPTNK